MEDNVKHNPSNHKKKNKDMLQDKTLPSKAQAFLTEADRFMDLNDIEAAILYYKKAIDTEPALSDAHFGLGNALSDSGKLKEAITAYQSAIQFQPDFFEAFYNLGSAHHHLGDDETATTCFNKALALKPDFADGWHTLGILHHNRGRLSDAITAYKKTATLSPEYPNIYLHMGMAFQSLKKRNKARSCFSKALSLDPSDVHAHFALGVLFKEMGEIVDAIPCFKHALRLNPEFAKAHYYLADILTLQKKYDEALVHYQKAIQLEPENSACYNNLGHLYKKMNNLEKASRCYVKVIQLVPDLPQGYYNLGNAFRLMGDFEKAVDAFKQTLRCSPNYPEAHNNLGLTYKQQGDIEKALYHMKQAVTLSPNLAEAHWNLSLSLLLNGDLSEGFKSFEWRFKQYKWKAIYPHRLEGRRWDGNPLPKGTIFVHDEQGFGDTIQFARYLPMVKKRCRQVIFETRPELINLFKRFPGIDMITQRTTDGIITMPFDALIPLMSLPMIFETTLDTIPEQGPYIHSDPEKERAFHPIIHQRKLNVGLVWAGRGEHPNDKNRSADIKAFAPIYNHPDLNVIGLQKDHQTKGSEKIINVGKMLKDFSYTAALINQLDLLVSVDTASAHLAGAMGKEVWVLIGTISDWRWLQKKETTPWYPTMKLFRQNLPGHWDDVIERMMAEIKMLTTKQSQVPLPPE